MHQHAELVEYSARIYKEASELKERTAQGSPAGSIERDGFLTKANLESSSPIEAKQEQCVSHMNKPNTDSSRDLTMPKAAAHKRIQNFSYRLECCTRNLSVPPSGAAKGKKKASAAKPRPAAKAAKGKAKGKASGRKKRASDGQIRQQIKTIIHIKARGRYLGHRTGLEHTRVLGRVASETIGVHAGIAGLACFYVQASRTQTSIWYTRRPPSHMLDQSRRFAFSRVR